jgi:hypothetical protein
MGTLHENLCTCRIMSQQTLLRMRTVSDKSCKNTHTHTHKFYSQ